MSFFAGKTCYIIISASINSAVPGQLTNANYVDAYGAFVPVQSPGVNSSATLSLDKYTIDDSCNLVSVFSFNSGIPGQPGQEINVPGKKTTKIVASGPHNLNEFTGLVSGLTAICKMGLAGSAAASINSPASVPQIVFYNLPVIIESIQETVNAEGREDIEVHMTGQACGWISWPG